MRAGVIVQPKGPPDACLSTCLLALCLCLGVVRCGTPPPLFLLTPAGGAGDEDSTSRFLSHSASSSQQQQQQLAHSAFPGQLHGRTF